MLQVSQALAEGREDRKADKLHCFWGRARDAENVDGDIADGKG